MMFFLLFYGFSNFINVSPKEDYSLGESKTKQQEYRVFSFEGCKNNNGVVIKDSASNINTCHLNSRVFFEGIFGFIVNWEYFTTLEKKCKGNSCCLNSISKMHEEAYMEAYLNSNNDWMCPSSFKLTKLKCDDSLFWCEPMETFKGLNSKQWHKDYWDILKKIKSKSLKKLPLAYMFTSWEKTLKIKIGMSKKELIHIVGQFSTNSNFNNIVFYYSLSPVGLKYEIAVKFSKELVVEDLSYIKKSDKLL